MPAAPYTVVARRYRPQQFADLVGQEAVAAGLANAIRADRVAHAYLFTGGRGMGKTTTARIFAKALNCVHGPTPTPCDQCDNCRRITGGDDVDVVEIDAATNTQVDHIRDLKANAGFRPLHSRYKIYIIDEVHMLSGGSFNALLKTLEEPPAHVKFVLATTELRKIPETILSRCQRFDFAAITPEKVFQSLKRVAEREGVAASEDALRLLSRRANGSMRDAQTLLEQTLSAVEGELTAEKLHRTLGTAPDERVAALAGAILAKDPKATLDQLALATRDGVQAGDLLDQLTEFWRGLMLELVAGPNARDLPGGPSLQESVRAMAPAADLDAVLAGIDILTATREKTRSRGSHTQVLLEVAAVRMARLDDLLTVAALAQMWTGASPPPGSPPPAAQVALPKAAPKPVAPPESVKVPEEPPVKKPVAPAASGPAALEAGAFGDITDDNLPDVWAATLSTLGRLRQDGLKKAGLPAIIGPNALAVRLPADYSAEYALLGSDATLEAVRKVLKKLTGRDCLLKVELLPAGSPRPTPIALADDAPARPATPASAPAERTKDLMRLPLFVKAAQALGAQLVRVEDGFNPHLVATLDADEAETAIPE